jgi:hypothetical protein
MPAFVLEHRSVRFGWAARQRALRGRAPPPCMRALPPGDACFCATALDQVTINARRRACRLGDVAGGLSARTSPPAESSPDGRTATILPVHRLSGGFFHLPSAHESAELSRPCRSPRGERDASFAAFSGRGYENASDIEHLAAYDRPSPSFRVGRRWTQDERAYSRAVS